MLKSILDIILMVVGTIMGFLLCRFVIQTIKFLLKKPKIKVVAYKQGYSRLKHYSRLFYKTLRYLRNCRYSNMYEFIKWILIDIIRGTVKYKIFGIFSFTGYFGEGKSLGAVNYALKIKKLYPFVHIYSNFEIKGQDKKLTRWQDILTLPKYSIVIWDEIHSDFNNLDYANFPLSFLRKITQCRKKKLALFTISQVFSRMSIQLKENTSVVVECENVFGFDRWFKYSFYKCDKYEKYCDDRDVLKKHRMYTYTLIAQDANYNKYNTEEEIQRAEDLEETQKIKGLTKADVIKICEYEFKKYEGLKKKNA